ncbi:hypothetical protein FQN57_005498 [Myotisia sp. PD_48]|nr:hypothetical protein FQN57_005498 [Myotisia sp. PD_48]
MQLLKKSLLFLGALLPLLTASPLPQSPRKNDIIPGRYIVTLKEGSTKADLENHVSWAASVQSSNLALGSSAEGVRKIFSINKYNGYSGTFDAKSLEEIRANPEVAYIEPDRVVYLADIVEQQNAPWGLGSISHRTAGATTFAYDSNGGTGTYAYVMDTGINTAHVDFEGRAILGYNAMPRYPHRDTNGHGTHVAGSIGSKTYGVAKKATLISVKVFEGSQGTYEAILDAYRWSVDDITKNNRKGKAAINMSISGGVYQPLNSAIESAFQAGVTTVVAAGNDGHDASRNSPASAANAITVGAIRSDNTRASFSNYGRVLDIFAPGENILSTWIGSTSATRSISGTSMATPHITGLVNYLQSLEDHPTPTSITNRLIELATTGQVKSPGSGSPNRLAYNNSGRFVMVAA